MIPNLPDEVQCLFCKETVPKDQVHCAWSYVKDFSTLRFYCIKCWCGSVEAWFPINDPDLVVYQRNIDNTFGIQCCNYTIEGDFISDRGTEKVY